MSSHSVQSMSLHVVLLATDLYSAFFRGVLVMSQEAHYA